MTDSLLKLQSGLPRSLPLLSYAPEREPFSWRDWDPSSVRSASDLPQYLILGALDPSTFTLSDGSWSARWQGSGQDTHFDVAYRADDASWKISQTWRGVGGGFSIYKASTPLDKVIQQLLYMKFPRSWDKEAKSYIESAYQIAVVEQPEKFYTFCGIPDGAFRTIIFPISVRNLRPVRHWLEDIVEQFRPAYPITAEARMVFQTINYMEGKAPVWTTQDEVAFNQSMMETGLVPNGFPVRKTVDDGSAAWTLRRQIYFIFISLPFAGLTDFLERMASSNGPIRTALDPHLRSELRLLVLPAGFEGQTESLVCCDIARTTQSFVQFELPGQDGAATTVEQGIEEEMNVSATLEKIEAISDGIVKAVEEMFQTVSKSDELIISGKLIDGPDVDLIGLSGLQLTPEEEDIIWGEWSPRRILVELLYCEEIELEELEGWPGMSDSIYEYRCGNREDFIARLTDTLLEILGRKS